MPGEGIPEIKWGTFHDKFGIAHIAPVCEDGILMARHILDLSCHCSPTIDRDPRVTIVVHNVIH